MAPGHKTGGRSAGTPNHQTREVAELLESLDCNPIEGMVKIAENPENPPELRGRMYAELAHYVFPKRKSIEVSGERLASEVNEITVRFIHSKKELEEAEGQVSAGE
jgi:hypothetical protein